jgi:TolB-like protein/tetratricopeptide (TPR) repeat protein
MRALSAAGNAAAAIQHASVHAALVTREFGAAPAPEVVALAEQLRASGVSQLKSIQRSEAMPRVYREYEEGDGKLAPADAPAATEERLPTHGADDPGGRYFRRMRSWSAGVFAISTLLLIGSLTLLFAGGRSASSAEDASLGTVAVLPLINDTGDPSQEHFADAMTEALITELAREIDLRVISRTSVMRYKEPANRNLPQIARELNADVIVEGSVFRDGDQVRITAQLIRASTDEHLWAESYDGNAHDIFALQARVARAVAQQIGVKLASRGGSMASTAGPVDPAAYEAYTRGRASAGLKSIAALEEAIRLAPEFAAAYATLADRLAILGFFGFLPPDSAFGAARKAALQALAMNGDLAEAHGALGIVLLHHDWNWQGAEKHFRRALALNPSSAYLRHMFAHQLLAHGRNAESARESARAAKLDPFNASLIACSGWHGLAHGQHETAVRESVRALRLEPGSFWPEMILGWAYEREGRYSEAITALRDAVSHSGGSSFALASLAHAHAAAGEERTARDILAELLERTETQYVSAYEIAAVYAGLGEKENAFAWLERAYGERSSFLINLAWEPRFHSLRGDPRFGELIRKVGLPQRLGRA